MRLVCLECSAVYEAPDKLFGPQPREVRCNRCGYQWTVIGSRPEDSVAPAALSVGPVAPLAPEAEWPPAQSFAVAPAAEPRVEAPSAPAPNPPPPTPLRSPSRLADTLAGTLPPGDRPGTTLTPGPRDGGLGPSTVIPDPPAVSTRTLLAGSPTAPPGIALPDPEERRLSHDLDFGATEPLRRPIERSGSSRRIVIIIILLIILAGIAAMIFKAQIIVAVPALKAAYGAVGL